MLLYFIYDSSVSYLSTSHTYVYTHIYRQGVSKLCIKNLKAVRETEISTFIWVPKSGVEAVKDAVECGG